MSEGKISIGEQMERLQTLMHRIVFHNYVSEGKPTRNPYRGQGRVLAALNAEPEISQKELTKQLGMSKQSLAELLGKLEKNGLIRRTPSEKDRRSVIVRLLPAGREAACELGDFSCDVEYIFDCLNPEEQEQLGGYLERIMDRCAESFPGESAEERRQRMESYLSYHNYGFRRIELNAAVAAEHKKRRQKCKENEETARAANETVKGSEE